MSAISPQIICANSVQAGSQLAVTIAGFSSSGSPTALPFFVVGAPPVGSPAIPIDPNDNGTIYTPNDEGVVSFTWDILQTAPAGSYVINALDTANGITGRKTITITAFTAPPKERILTFSNNIEIRTQAVLTNKNVEYEVLFDNTEWQVTRVTWEVSATQTHYAGVGEAQLDVGAYIISKNPDGSALMGQKTLKWNLLNGFDSVQQWGGARDVTVTGSVPEKVFVRMNHAYRIPLPSLTEQLCAINETVKVVLKAIVENPTTNPTVGTPAETTTDPPPGGGWNLGSFFGGLSTGVVIALAAVLLVMLKK